MPILLCVPWVKANPRHMDHLIEFYAFNKAKFDIRLFRMFWKALYRVQQCAVNEARRIEASHILFTEDDQWGYPIDGLDHLLAADKDVIGFKSYFKEYPFKPMTFRRRNPTDSLIEMNPIDHVERGDGPDIQQVDMISWAFTLVNMSVFDRMHEAGLDPFRQQGPHPTDSFFGQYCSDLGIPIHAHFGFTIGHGDVGPDEIIYRRRIHEVMEMDKRQTLRVQSEVVARDDHGNPYGNTDLVPEGTKALLNEQPHAEGEQCVS